MKHLLRSLLLGVLISGCAVDRPNPWDSIEIDESPVTAPLTLPEMPKPEIVGDTVVLTAPQAQEIREYGIIARANTEIASEYSQSINARKQANTALVEAGKAQRVQAEIIREQLADERKHNLWNNLTLYAIIIAMGFAL